ncbi:MAG: glycosyltransferase family 4 protein [Tyzzerella sp.]|uniref:Glycosyltransferase family 4 protein n=1 Tax=Candidatus Fimicola merdigallinarum TaxID=2840819 RepID=A0A9D9DX68_9FIRM|nr:glycosyltransferase family 4 protein [Candidatus Fimicola merdigallinarum]
MNIGLFTDTYFPQINGVGTSVHTLAEGLRKRGHNVYIFTPSDPKITEDEKDVIRMPSMPFFMVKGFRVGLLYTPRALNKIAHLKLDIIHTQTEFSLGLFGRMLSKTLNIPTVHTYHTMYVDYVHYVAKGNLITPNMAKEFSKSFCNKAGAVIAPTKKVYDSLTEYGVKKDIEIIPTGINTELFKRSNFSKEEIDKLKEEIGLNPKDPTILYLGRLAQEKSIDVIINAMPKLLENIENLKFVIVGDGPERPELEKLVESLNLNDNVIFTGAKPWSEIGKYYQLGDLFISASTSETQGLTFAEAMAGGLPVIARRDECLENIVIPEKTGFLFDTPEELPEMVAKILNDKDTLKAYSENAIEVMEELSVENFALRVDELYASVIEAEKQPHTTVPLIISKLPTKKAVRRIKKIPTKVITKGKRAVTFFKMSRYGIVKVYKKEFKTTKSAKEGNEE